MDNEIEQLKEQKRKSIQKKLKRLRIESYKRVNRNILKNAYSIFFYQVISYIFLSRQLNNFLDKNIKYTHNEMTFLLISMLFLSIFLSCAITIISENLVDNSLRYMQIDTFKVKLEILDYCTFDNLTLEKDLLEDNSVNYHLNYKLNSYSGELKLTGSYCSSFVKVDVDDSKLKKEVLLYIIDEL